MRALLLTMALALSPLSSAEPSLRSAMASPRSILRKALCPFKKNAAARLLSEHLLEESTADEMLSLLEAIGKQYGKCRKLEELAPGRYRFEFKDVELEAELKVNKQNQLVDFNFGEAVYRNDDFSKLEGTPQDANLPLSLWLDKEGEKVFAYKEDQPLNVSRASYLFLVKALNEAVAKGNASLKDTIRLQAETKSISFGLLHHWANGTLVTYDTLKNLVGVENDAAAADLLIQALGREQIEKQRAFLKPILTFREIARLHEDYPTGELPKSREEALAFLSKLPDSGKVVSFPEGRPELAARIG